jgi:hypothetical protein
MRDQEMSDHAVIPTRRMETTQSSLKPVAKDTTTPKAIL